MVFCVVAARVFSEVSRVWFEWLLGCSVRFLRCCQGGCSGVARVWFGWLLGCSVRFLRCCQGGCSGVARALIFRSDLAALVRTD